MDKSRRQKLQELVEKFGQAIKRIHAGHIFALGGSNISRPEAFILIHVAGAKSGTAIKELTKRLGVTPGAVTQFIDSLVKKGLVVRQEDRLDRRITTISLTASARRHIDKLLKNYFKSVSSAFSGFETEEIELFVSLLDKITEPKLTKKK